MRYIPKVSHESVEENHRHFMERVSIFKKRGFDFSRSLRFVLKKAEPLHGSILEIGTGTGHTMLAMAKAGYKFTSIDKDKDTLKIAALNLAYAKLLPLVEFHAMDGKKLKFKNSSFNNIIAVSVFHHISSVEKMLIEIDRVLSKNGKIVFADFNSKGMAIVNSVHKHEGRVHECTDASKEKIFSYFHGLGYDMDRYNSKSHWVIIGKKIIRK